MKTITVIERKRCTIKWERRMDQVLIFNPLVLIVTDNIHTHYVGILYMKLSRCSVSPIAYMVAAYTNSMTPENYR